MVGGVCPNSMDAVSDRDFVLEFAFFSSTLMVHLSRSVLERLKRGRLASKLDPVHGFEISFSICCFQVGRGSHHLQQWAVRICPVQRCLCHGKQLDATKKEP